MPDPIDELEGFTMPSVTPLPPFDVRRRGDRIRRRNRALTAAGGLAVVAAIVAPIAIAAGHTPATAPLPPTTTVEWHQTIPAGFDLTAVPDGAPVGFTAQAKPVFDNVTICGSVIFSTGSASDRAGATYQEAGTESAMARTLAVYADDRAATAALANYRQGIEACPVDQPEGGSQLEYDVVGGAPAPAQEGFVYSEQVNQGGQLYSDLSVVEVVQVGNALFVATTHGSVGGPDQVAAETTRLADLSDPVLAQLCVFSAKGC